MKNDYPPPQICALSVIATELDANAHLGKRQLLEHASSILDVDTTHIRNALTKRMRVHELAQMANYHDNPVLTQRIFLLARALVKTSHPAASVFLEDLAEWLIIPSPVRRALLTSGGSEVQAAA